MADFQTQVEALTGLSIGTGVTVSQLSQFLKDGVIDVTNRCTLLKPTDISLFSKESAEQTSNGLDLNGAKLVSVVRESGTNNDWRACRAVSPDVQSRVTDVSSIHYASKLNPAFSVLDNGEINVFPAPGSNPDAFKVYYVNNVPLDKSGAALAYNHSDIKYFDDSKVYLVVLYASMKSLDHLVEAAQGNLPDSLTNIVLENVTKALPTFSISSIPAMVLPVAPIEPAIVLNSASITGTTPTYTVPVASLTPDITIDSLSISSTPPVAPTISDTSISFSTSVPTYLAPVLSLEATPTISDLTISSSTPTIPIINDPNISFTTTAPTFIPPVVAPDFSDADTWINDEEDSEMSGARVQVIQAQLQEYQLDIQNNLNKFNEENAEYQIEFQKASQQSTLEQKQSNDIISKFNVEIQRYTSEVNKQVQEYQSNFNKDVKLWETTRATGIQKYQVDITNALNTFNKENTQYQIEFSKATQDAQLSSTDDVQKISKFQQELQKYASEVGKEVQEYSSNTAVEIQLFTNKRTSEIQKYQSDMQNNLNKFNEENVLHTAQLQVDLQNASLKDTKEERDLKVYTQNLAKYQAQVNAEVQRWGAEELTKLSADFTNNLAAYSAEYQQVAAKNQSIVLKYNTDVKNYMNLVGKTKMDVDLYHQRSMKIEKQYNDAFMLMAPKQQQQKERRRR